MSRSAGRRRARQVPLQEDPRRRDTAPWVIVLAVVAAGVGVYAGGLGHPFIFDDLGSIVHNTQIRSLEPAVALAPPPETPVGGRPLVNLSFALNYAAGGLDPSGFRIVNILLHAGNALLLFGVVRRTWSGPRVTGLAGAVALIWAVHPLNSEAVSYVTQRTELMMAACYLFTLYASARAAGGATAWTLAAIAACAAGMACKESMVTAPVAVIAFDRVFRYQSFADAWSQRRGLYVGLLASWGVLATLMWTVPRTTGSGFATTHVSSWTYLLNQTEMIVRYLRLAVWPDSLVLYYGWATPATIAAVWPYGVAVLLVLAATAVALVRVPKAGILLFWVFLTLAPTSSVVPIGSEVGAERRMYLPLAGLVALAVIGVSRLADRQHVQGGAVAAVIVAGVLGYLTVERTREYATPLGMAQTVLERWPTPTAHYMVGTELVAAGRVAESVAHLRQAAAAIPPARFNLGSALFTSGQPAAGMTELEAFLRAEPDLVSSRDARLLLARGYAESGRLDDSLAMAREVLSRVPNDHAAHGLMAEAYVAQGRFEAAIPHYESYLRTQPDDGAAWTGLGIACMSSGRPADGVTAFGRAVAAAPNHAGYRMNLARALLDTGQPHAAVEHADKAVQLTQGDPAARELLDRARR